MALRVGYRGPCSNVRAERKLLDASRWIVDSCMARVDMVGTARAALCSSQNVSCLKFRCGPVTAALMLCAKCQFERASDERALGRLAGFVKIVKEFDER